MAYYKKALKILVVEDNPGDYALIEGFLSEQIDTPELSNAVNYKKAKELINLADAKFDIILLDLTLPDKGGVPLIIDIVKLSAGTPIIVLTGYSDFEYGVQSLSLGVADYILKDELTSFSLYKSIIYSLERKNAILLLEESEKRYSKLFHLNPLPMWVYDVDSLRFLDVNDPAVDHYGYSRKEFLSLTINDIRPAEDIVKIEEALEDNKSKQRANLDGIFRHRKKNNEIIDVDIISSIIEYKGKKAKIILVKDVTDQLQQFNISENQNKKLKDIAVQLSLITAGPLSSSTELVTSAKLMKDSAEKEIKLTQVLKSVKALKKRLKNIIDDINS